MVGAHLESVGATSRVHKYTLLLLTEGTVNGAKYTSYTWWGYRLSMHVYDASRLHDLSPNTWYAFGVWS